MSKDFEADIDFDDSELEEHSTVNNSKDFGNDDLDFGNDELAESEDYESEDYESEDVNDMDEEDSSTSEEETDEEGSIRDKEKSGGILKKLSGKPVDKILYIVADRVLPGELEYFRENGVLVSQVFSSIQDASDALIMQVMPTRLIVLDTGNGRFTNMAARRQLIDMLGISADAETDVSVFYTDTVIKAEVDDAEHVERDMINWFKYKSTADVVANILISCKKYNENYVYDSEKDDIEPDKEDPLNFTGLTTKFESGMDLGSAAIDIHTIVDHLDEEETSIEGFSCTVRPMRKRED